MQQYWRMELRYELTKKDFYDSFVAHRNRFPVSKWAFRLVALGIFSLVVIGLLGIAAHPGLNWITDVGIVLFAILWAGILWGRPWWTARRQLSEQPSLRGSRTMLVDAVGVHWRWDGGSADVKWKNFIRGLESKTEILLYTSPLSFNIVPKRALTPGQLVEFRNLLVQNLPRA
jgi:hypothetical protein